MTDTLYSPAAAPLAELHDEAQAILARYPEGRERSALLPLLHLVQSVEGYVSPAGVAFCAEVLGINKAQVGAVATFYTMYKRRPTGDYLVSVCTNTMCNVLGGQEVYDTLTELLGVGHQETTADGTVTLEHAECLAACDYGPVMTVNYDFYDNVTPESAAGVVQGLQAGQRPAPTRGARLCTLKEMSKQLAGFADVRDGAVADGPAGAPTLRGVTLAQEHGVAVPGFNPDTPIPTTKPAPERPGDHRVATAAKKVASTVKSAATNVAGKVGEKVAHRNAGRDVPAGDVKDPESRAAEARNPDASTPAPDATGASTAAGTPVQAGAGPDAPAGDGKPVGDEGGRAQERNLEQAEEKK
ncbi:NADH-quinone oxidoreductase subunit NuoE [Spirilliplanes yamanashiensis]|uniref:NADH dehydrogenase subunit E n=1 Tax=Spirilliplanes yamanashiensis TaxID=42233 RepID=A0A8J4DJV1_9ACTN|nr:NADH-quinone oxidoreductase subunit NuoE [Spirilliplanes yamanashiensis]MDP9815373.1 NADH-quinone oxidoreductase subunit E [Spirilliplanes yamanashiensis]GIJ03628.1 hypothetical protein Sya03_29800 [Spirilliplanes yamanashiensis]